MFFPFKSIFEPIPTDIIDSFTTETTRYERIRKKEGSDPQRNRGVSELYVDVPLGEGS